MFRSFAALLGLAVLLGVAPAAPVPTHLMKTSPFLPTRVGTKWVFQTNSKEEVETITKSEEQRDGTLVTVERSEREFCYLVSKSGVHLVSQAWRRFVQPIPVLKLPHRPGTTWEAVNRAEGEAKGLFGEPTTSYAAHEQEEVEVPAGKFLTIRVEATYIGNQKATSWYARGVGEVKSLGLGDDKKELKSFIPAKD